MIVAALFVLLPAVLVVPQRPGPGPSITELELRITDARGGPIQNARVEAIAAVRPGLFRTVPDLAAWNLKPADFQGDYAILKDLPAGEYTLKVEADLFALTLSEPFTIPATKAPRLTVRMQAGTRLEGVVRDPEGKPIANVEVRTEDDSAGDEAPFLKLMGFSIAPVTTATSVQTDANGKYQLDHLARGAYRIVASHADYAPALEHVQIKKEERRSLPPLQLAAGVLVVGLVTRGGKPVVGAEVTLQSEPDPQTPQNKIPRIECRYTVKSDEQGRFRMPVRIPRGKRFVLMADEGGLPMQRAEDIQASQHTITAHAGPEEQIELLTLAKR